MQHIHLLQCIKDKIIFNKNVFKCEIKKSISHMMQTSKNDKKHITICSIGQQLSQKKQESSDLDKDLKGLRPENKPTTLNTTEKLNKVESSISNIVQKQKVKKS